MEAPTINGSITDLAPYTPDAHFYNLAIAGAETTLTDTIMVQNGDIVSDPSPLSPSAGFDVAYGSSPAPAP